MAFDDIQYKNKLIIMNHIFDIKSNVNLRYTLPSQYWKAVVNSHAVYIVQTDVFNRFAIYLYLIFQYINSGHAILPLVVMVTATHSGCYGNAVKVLRGATMLNSHGALQFQQQHNINQLMPSNGISRDKSRNPLHLIQ